MKTILITGAAGFIGRHLVQRVLETTDWNIVAIDGLSYAADTVKLVRNSGYDKSRVRLYWHDLRAPVTDELKQQLGYADYIVNVASNSHVERSISSPAEFFLNNAALIANVLEYARFAMPEKFVQISTDEVFGPAYGETRHKEWDVHCPSNPYSASKSAQEALSISYWRTFALPLVITNTMNNFGEGQHHEKFVPMIVRKILAEEEIPVHGKWCGDEFVPGSRYWLHASSHADALIYLLNHATPARYPEEVRPSRWNIVGEEEVDNLEMVMRIGRIMGRTPRVRRDDFHSSRPGHDLRYALDGSKLRASGWLPGRNLDKALEDTVRATMAEIS